MVSERQQKRAEFATVFWQGGSASVIMKKLAKKGIHIPLSTIKDWGKRLRENPFAFYQGRKFKRTGNPKSRRRGSPPLSLGDKVRIREHIRSHPEQSLRTTAVHLPADIHASKTTIHHQRVLSGLKARHRHHKPKLSVKDKRRRNDYGHGNKQRNWAYVSMSDEFACTTVGSTNSHNDVYYAFSAKEVPSRPTVKYPISESRLAVITSKGAIPLIPIRTNPTALQLQGALDIAIPQIDRLLRNENMFLHDLSAAFKAKSTQQYLQEHVPAFFSSKEYPPQSPDMNLTENTISDTKRWVHKLRPRNRAELIAALNKGWAQATTPTKLQHLYDSMPARIEAVIRAKGGNTRF